MIVVYSAIFGGSDRLKRAPKGPHCVCFTDDPNLVGDRWEVVLRPATDRPRRAARVIKMTPQDLFPDADASVWVDGSIEFKDWPRFMQDCADAEIACFDHPDRSNCYDEGEAVIRLKIAHDIGKDQVRAALAKYRAEGFAPKTLSTTGLFYRKHTERVAAFNAMWRDDLNNYGTNDQVHVDYCAWKTGVPIRHLQGHYRDNPYATYDKTDHHKRRKPQFLLEKDCQNYLADA